MACLRSAMLLLALAWLAQAAGGAESERAWLTSVALERQLAAPVSLQWSGRTLRDALGSISQAYGVATLLDRRIDPGQTVDMQATEVPLTAVLERLAQRHNAAAAPLEGVVYLGPQRASAVLRTVSALRTDDARALPAELQVRWLKAKDWRWDELATPRELVVQLAEEAGAEVSNLQLLPHDLWAAADLAPLTLPQRLSLVLVQFDLTYQLDSAGAVITLVPLPERPVLVRRYPGGSLVQQTAERLASLVPEAEVAVDGREVVVTGRWEDHERLKTGAARPSTARQPATGAKDVYTLTVQNKPLGVVLDFLAERLGLTVVVDDATLAAAGVSRDTLVSLSVKDAELDALLTAALEPIGLAFRRAGQRVEIMVAGQ